MIIIWATNFLNYFMIINKFKMLCRKNSALYIACSWKNFSSPLSMWSYPYKISDHFSESSVNDHNLDEVLAEKQGGIFKRKSYLLKNLWILYKNEY